MGRPARIAGIGLATALLTAPAVQAADQWSYRTPRHLKDSKVARISNGDFFNGRMRLIDNFVTASRQRFRSRKHGKRKRVYLVQGSLALRVKEGYRLLGAGCRQSVPSGAFMLLAGDGTRAFFPRPGDHIKPVSESGSIGLSGAGLSISLPFPRITFYDNTSLAPNVKWTSFSSHRHNWSWVWDDGDHNPRTALLGFAGHWGASAKGISYKIKCLVVSTNRDGLEGGEQTATLTMTRSAVP